MINLFVWALNTFVTIINILVLAYIILSYFVDIYHPVRMFVDRLVNPLLNPIRRVVPLVGMFDFSPFILIILVQLLQRVLISLLSIVVR
jgi:YggT family protein